MRVTFCFLLFLGFLPGTGFPANEEGVDESSGDKFVPFFSRVEILRNDEGEFCISGNTRIPEGKPFFCVLRRGMRIWEKDDGAFREWYLPRFFKRIGIQSEGSEFRKNLGALSPGSYSLEIHVANVACLSRKILAGDPATVLEASLEEDGVVNELADGITGLLERVQEVVDSGSRGNSAERLAFKKRVADRLGAVKKIVVGGEWPATAARFESLLNLLLNVNIWEFTKAFPEDTGKGSGRLFPGTDLTIPGMRDLLRETLETHSLELRLMSTRRLLSALEQGDPELIRKTAGFAVELLERRPLEGEPAGFPELVARISKADSFEGAEGFRLKLNEAERRFLYFGSPDTPSKVRMMRAGDGRVLLTGEIDLPDGTVIGVTLQRERRRWNGDVGRFVPDLKCRKPLPVRALVRDKRFEMTRPLPGPGLHRVGILVQGRVVASHLVEWGGADGLYSTMANHGMPVAAVVEELCALLKVVREAYDEGGKKSSRERLAFKTRLGESLKKVEGFRRETPLSGCYANLLDHFHHLLNANVWEFQASFEGDSGKGSDRLFPMDPSLTADGLEARLKETEAVLAAEIRLITVRRLLKAFRNMPFSGAVRKAQAAQKLLVRFPLDPDPTGELIAELAAQTDASLHAELTGKLEALDRQVGVLGAR